MEKFEFKDMGEFTESFSERTPRMTLLIAKSISEAVKAKKKTANMFEVSIEGGDTSFEISLPKSQWETALGACLKYFEEWEMSDEAIDTYLLLKKVKA